jgi:hypothetical protein
MLNCVSSFFSFFFSSGFVSAFTSGWAAYSADAFLPDLSKIICLRASEVFEVSGRTRGAGATAVMIGLKVIVAPGAAAESFSAPPLFIAFLMASRVF